MMAKRTQPDGDSVMGRPPVKREKIVDALHRRIVTNKLRPGTRLPTRRELASRFNVSLVTAQSALEHLASEGFVESRGAAGSFVAERPPHLHTYAVVFPFGPKAPGFRLFWSTLSHVTQRLDSRRGCRI